MASWVSCDVHVRVCVCVCVCVCVACVLFVHAYYLCAWAVLCVCVCVFCTCTICAHGCVLGRTCAPYPHPCMHSAESCATNTGQAPSRVKGSPGALMAAPPFSAVCWACTRHLTKEQLPVRQHHAEILLGWLKTVASKKVLDACTRPTECKATA